jgi:site-specific DNA recombinase
MKGYVNVSSRPPYGYTMKSKPHQEWLEINEQEKNTVFLFFRLFTIGDPTIPRATLGRKEDQRWSLREIARHLTKTGIPKRSDTHTHFYKKHERGWTSATIRKILTNETYIGTWYYGKTQMVSDGKEASRKQRAKVGRGIQVPRPREQWIAVTVPALIDAATFQLAQARLEANKREIVGRPVKYDYLLNKRLRCAKCGYSMYPPTRRVKHQYYHCNGTRQPMPLCDVRHGFHVELIDSLVWKWLKQVMEHPECVMPGLHADRQEAERHYS